MILPVNVKIEARCLKVRFGICKPGVIVWWDIEWGSKRIGRLWHIIGKPQFWSRDIYEDYVKAEVRMIECNSRGETDLRRKDE